MSHKAEVRSLAVSPDGAYVAAGDETGVVRLWTNGGDLVLELGKHTDVVRDLVFAPDGRHLVSAGGDKVVRVHAIPSGTAIELTGNADGVKDLDISKDGAWVAAAGIDGGVRVWPIGGGEPHTFRGHGTAVKGVVFAPGRRLISGAEDDRARIWRLDRKEPLPEGPALRAWINAHTNFDLRPPSVPR
jgi:WD40 repeat protein